MLNVLFRGLLEASSAYYGDSIGLAPISMSNAITIEQEAKEEENFWSKDCKEHPTRIACLNYDS
tara:strand:+ start:160 stop:351 length:192 start_codon:yes stop_codon:yes gene_type:complete